MKAPSHIETTEDGITISASSVQPENEKENESDEYSNQLTKSKKVGKDPKWIVPVEDESEVWEEAVSRAKPTKKSKTLSSDKENESDEYSSHLAKSKKVGKDPKWIVPAEDESEVWKEAISRAKPTKKSKTISSDNEDSYDNEKENESDEYSNHLTKSKKYPNIEQAIEEIIDGKTYGQMPPLLVTIL